MELYFCEHDDEIVRKEKNNVKLSELLSDIGYKLLSVDLLHNNFGDRESSVEFIIHYSDIKNDFEKNVSGDLIIASVSPYRRYVDLSRYNGQKNPSSHFDDVYVSIIWANDGLPLLAWEKVVGREYDIEPFVDIREVCIESFGEKTPAYMMSENLELASRLVTEYSSI